MNQESLERAVAHAREYTDNADVGVDVITRGCYLKVCAHTAPEDNYCFHVTQIPLLSFLEEKRLSPGDQKYTDTLQLFRRLYSLASNKNVSSARGNVEEIYLCAYRRKNRLYLKISENEKYKQEKRRLEKRLF